MTDTCLPPIFIDEVLADPTCVRRLVEGNAPYAPVQRYFAGDAEYRAASGAADDERPMFIAPVFRGDWAYDTPSIDGVDELFDHPKFVAAGQRIFGSKLVRPFSLYCNLTWQLPFDQGAGHTDIPEFRGISRTDHPTWILSMMGASGLFEEQRVNIVTVVAWFYPGSDGGFTYWPKGPDAPPKVHEGATFNTAIAGDNDRMYHRVRPTGDPGRGLISGMTLDTRLARLDDEEWGIDQDGEIRARFPFEDLRISISWKARVFRDDADEARYRDHSDDIAIDEVFDRFYADLTRQGVAFERPGNPLTDQDLIDLLTKRYVHAPTIYDEH